MKCLGCGDSSWVVHEAVIDPIVNNQKVSLKVLMFKCERCGQTSMDDDLYETFVNRCLKAYYRRKICELNDNLQP